MSTDVMLREAPPMLDYALDGEFVTLERYIEIAAASEHRIEYIDGVIHPLYGVRINHGDIQTNLIIALRSLHGGGYRLKSSKVCVLPTPTTVFFPDMSVVREPAQYADVDSDLLNPVMVVEVLSPSTRDKDLYDKLPRYLDMPSMEHILIIEQDSVSVEHHRRIGTIWTQTTYTDIADLVALDSLGASLPLAQVYNLIEFSPD